MKIVIHHDQQKGRYAHLVIVPKIAIERLLAFATKRRLDAKLQNISKPFIIRIRLDLAFFITEVVVPTKADADELIELLEEQVRT